MRWLAALPLVLVVLLLVLPLPLAAQGEGTVVVGQLRGIINPVSARYVDRALGAAES